MIIAGLELTGKLAQNKSAIEQITINSKINERTRPENRTDY